MTTLARYSSFDRLMPAWIPALMLTSILWADVALARYFCVRAAMRLLSAKSGRSAQTKTAPEGAVFQYLYKQLL
jgi:hypothetical protein